MDRSMYRVVENFLDPVEIQALKEASTKCLNTAKTTYRDRFTEPHLKSLGAAADFLGDPEFEPLLVEEWSFHNAYTTLPLLHQDRDEDLFEATGRLSFPACSCVLYLNIKDLEGGRLAIGEDTVVPQSGMLVLIAPEVWHEVEECYSGTRHSMNYNFWDVPLFNS